MRMCGRRKLIHVFIYISMYVVVICGDAEVMRYTSYEGGKVNIRCQNNQLIKNTKHLCRGPCSTVPVLGEDKDIPVQTARPPEDPRFTINDENFTVTITDLRREDGGQYWCAVEGNWSSRDSYNKILLSVKNVSHVSGVSGEKLSIKCHYGHDFINNDKFFCKGDNLSFCETFGVKVLREKETNGRFSLTDDTSARVFTVTITDLTEEDSGIYWCGNVVQKTSQYTHDKWISAINLTLSEVTSQSTTHKPTTASFHTTKPASTSSLFTPDTPLTLLCSSSSSSSSACPLKPQQSLIWIITLLVTVMLFGFFLFFYIRQRKKNKGLQLNDVTHTTSENQITGASGQTRVSVCDYEEIQLSNNDPDYSLVLPVSSEHEASVYALAQNISSDNLQYSTVRFSDHSIRTSHDGQTTCDYATVTL